MATSAPVMRGSKLATPTAAPLQQRLRAQVPQRSCLGHTRHAHDSAPQRSTTCKVAAFESVTTFKEQASYHARPAPQTLETFASKYELGDMLGKGTHAQVHVATAHATGQQFAVKVLLKQRAHRDRTVQVLMEVSPDISRSCIAVMMPLSRQ
jgi:hypothetical protein